MTPPDRRRHPWRSDLAASYLEGQVPSRHFVAGWPRQVRVGCAALRAAPNDRAEQQSQLLFGERVTLFEERDGWAWVQNRADGYVGYLHGEALDDILTEPTHWVAALRTFVYAQPDLKTPPREMLSLTSPVTVTGCKDGYAALAGGGWVFAAHLVPWHHTEPDFVATALRLLGTPYLWGGRSTIGLDCSALVQLALAMAGIAAPRDSDMQRAELGESLGPVSSDGAGLIGRRGDLVFFPGHVAIMLDAHTLVHATAFAMAVTIEPLAAVITRTDPSRGGGLSAVRRLRFPEGAGAA